MWKEKLRNKREKMAHSNVDYPGAKELKEKSDDEGFNPYISPAFLCECL
jgi:hypothetical protein